MGICSQAIKYTLSIILITFTSQINATTLMYDGSLISGVSNLEALGSTWDVTFNAGSYDDVYGQAPFQFASKVEAYDATVELTSSLNLLARSVYQDDIVGCVALDACYIQTPVSFDGDGIGTFSGLYSYAAKKIGNGIWEATPTITGSGDYVRTRDYDNISYAVWTETVVPVPASVWLFSSGLIGLVGLARRKIRA